MTGLLRCISRHVPHKQQVLMTSLTPSMAARSCLSTKAAQAAKSSSSSALCTSSRMMSPSRSIRRDWFGQPRSRGLHSSAGTSHEVTLAYMTVLTCGKLSSATHGNRPTRTRNRVRLLSLPCLSRHHELIFPRHIRNYARLIAVQLSFTYEILSLIYLKFPFIHAILCSSPPPRRFTIVA